MQIGSVVHNFTVKNVRSLPEIDTMLWEMEHKKSGAKLVWLDRAEENKAFGIAFKTIPEDSTGVFHILEHSVLGGSEKYPVKEPFVELLKSSVNTFLNAFTFPDKTVYPFSSRNDKDFLNLLDVYLDAVLHPAIYHKPEIFRQEGWRYELRDGADPVYSGVVFNEMKGAFASADSVLEETMSGLMFPDNCYSYCSGGDPEYILDLTYEQFIANHQKYYHPSNSRIILAGSIHLDAVLEKIDSVLSAYTRQEANFPIPMQQPVPYQETVIPYEIGAEEDPANRTIVSCGHMLGRFDDQEKIYAAAVLRDYLAGDNDAPLKQAILTAGLGQDVKFQVHDGIQQNWISWEVWNTELDKLEAIKETVNRVFTDLAENGLDQDRLEACFNRFAFQMRDKDGGWLPRGLNEGLNMLESWLYDGDPAQYLLVEDALNDLERRMKEGYFEELIRSTLIHNDHKVMGILVPSQTLGQEKRDKEAARMKAEQSAWTEADLARIQEDQRILTAWQQSTDTPEALATMPVLELSDIDPNPEKLSVEYLEQDGVTVLEHRVDTALTYLNLYFDASDLTVEELPAAALLARLLGKLPTEQYSAAQVQMLTKQKIGKLNFAVPVFSGKQDSVRVLAQMVCLSSQKESAADLVGQMLTATKFDDVALLKNLLNQAMMQLQMEFVGGGHQYAMTRASSMVNAADAAKEALTGSTFIQWVKQQCAADDAALEALLAQLKALAEKIFVRSRMTVSVSDNSAELAERMITKFCEGQPSSGFAIQPFVMEQLGLPIPAPIGFASRASNLTRHGGSYTGSAYVLANVLNFSYLWNEIRVQGGAYGAGFGSRDDGSIFYYTFRDPQPGRSLGIFAEAANFIRNFCTEGVDLTRMILGSVSNADPLLNTRAKIGMAETMYFKGTTYEDQCRMIRELIGTTPDDLLALADVLEKTCEDNAVCVVAGQSLLDACGEQLSGISQIL